MELVIRCPWIFRLEASEFPLILLVTCHHHASWEQTRELQTQERNGKCKGSEVGSSGAFGAWWEAQRASTWLLSREANRLRACQSLASPQAQDALSPRQQEVLRDHSWGVPVIKWGEWRHGQGTLAARSSERPFSAEPTPGIVSQWRHRADVRFPLGNLGWQLSCRTLLPP